MLKTLEEKVDPKNAALLVVDMQNDFCHPEGSLARRGRDMALGLQMTPRLVRLLEEARQKQLPIIFIRQTLSELTTSPANREHRRKRLPEGFELPLQEGSWGAEYYEVAPQPGECVVTKHRYSAFVDTSLDLILRSNGIKTLIMTGVATNVCVESTARDGYMTDYYIVFVSDCTATERIEDHEATLRNIEGFFGEVAISEEIIEHIAIRIPGLETDVLAEKAKQWDVYIAAANLEYDPDWPDVFFNSGFIINPKGKIILKYRKTVTNVAVAMHCSVHDLMETYKNPVTNKYDPFPVVDTEIGRLAIFICVDLRAPEIPRVYSMKGAEVVMHLTSGMSHSDGRGVPMGSIEAALQTRAWDNAVYLINSNWGPELGAYYPRARISGWSSIYDYRGNELITADDSNEHIITAMIDIEACRRYRKLYFRNPISLIRTELYAPYYKQPIYPVNTFLRDGPIEELLNEQQLGYFRQAMENVMKLQDFYSENDVP